MKRLIVPLALVGMSLLLLVAMSVDCVRLANDQHRRVVLADAELTRHESRLISLLEDSKKVSPEMRSALDAYKSATHPLARHPAYDRLVSALRKESPSAVDPTNPLDRKFMDEVAGTINRREVAEKQYLDEAGHYKAYLESWRGRLARRFSTQARTDLAESP